MKQQELEQLVQDYQGLFYKVLRRCSIFPGQTDFEDYFQELRILFFLRAEKYESRGYFEAENNISYLFRYLLWYLIDEKRKEQKAGIKVQDEFLLEIQIEEADYDTLAELAEFETFYHQLKAKDQQKVVALLTDEKLSRQSRSRYRKYFRENFKLFFKKV
ncbi:hypothetical protein DOK78_002976 [Enterococcus sp. DIV2402]|uniref:Sigma-70 family RNA polymerase sigma factor n=1 Tax=Candidatus Enterococcus lowellii TaxID=2230877 RepID=A0ABZ2SWJ0_9ENTE|nr:sigma-70 family RNA polymerase sigma factor [Enterococcus sp. DIV2402]MBO0465361.1 sigma-70 family RNA polymerase sigma factor [Enterococcus sp. DIV2402]